VRSYWYEKEDSHPRFHNLTLLWIQPVFSISQGEGRYELAEHTLPDAFEFDIDEPAFVECFSELLNLLEAATVKRLSELPGGCSEGTWEYEVYMWLYQCFSLGCSEHLERAW